MHKTNNQHVLATGHLAKGSRSILLRNNNPVNPKIQIKLGCFRGVLPDCHIRKPGNVHQVASEELMFLFISGEYR